MSFRILSTMVLGLAAAGYHAVLQAQPNEAGNPPSGAASHAEPTRPLAREIEEFIFSLRAEMLDRVLDRRPLPAWFDRWDDEAFWDDDGAWAWDDEEAWPWVDEPLPADDFEAWSDEGPIALEGEASRAAADSDFGSMAISLAEADGLLVIEAALDDARGRHTFRFRGNRSEVEAWLNQLPPAVRQAIARRLPAFETPAAPY